MKPIVEASPSFKARKGRICLAFPFWEATEEMGASPCSVFPNFRYILLR
jgi:hypothetical protein